MEILRPHGKNIIVGCLYRPPDSSLNDFNRSVEDILSATSFENKRSYIMGDFNINILNSHSHQPTSEFINLMTSKRNISIKYYYYYYYYYYLIASIL